MASGLTYKKMCNQVELILAQAFGAKDRLVSPALIQEWVNSAYQEVDRKLRWTRCTHVFDSVKDQAAYTITTRVREYIAVEMADANGKVYKLERISLNEYIHYRETSTTSSRPSYWVHHGDAFYLYPMPDETYSEDDEEGYRVTIYIVGEPADLSDDEDTPGWPAHLHQLVVTEALSYAYRLFAEEEKALALQAAVNAVVVTERREPAMDRGGKGKVEVPPL